MTYQKQKNNHEIKPSAFFPQQKTKKTKEVFCFTSSVSSTRTFDQNIIRAKLDLNPILRVVGKVKIWEVKAKL